MSPYRLLAPARREYLQAVRYYRDEVQDADLARDFIARFRQRLERVRALPRAGAQVTGLEARLGVRRVKLHRFPFYVFFTVQDDAVVVIAVAHERRRPGYWLDRVDDV